MLYYVLLYKKTGKVLASFYALTDKRAAVMARGLVKVLCKDVPGGATKEDFRLRETPSPIEMAATAAPAKKVYATKVVRPTKHVPSTPAVK